MSEEERAGYKGDTIDLVHLEQNGVALKVDKVEFAEKETRVYITETNSSSDNCSINVYDIKILQNGKLNR